MSSRYAHTPGKEIHSYYFEKELLLFDLQTQQLILLNPTSRVLWEGIKSGYTIDEIIEILAIATGFGQKQILTDVNSIMAQWEDLGLFKTGNKDIGQYKFKKREGICLTRFKTNEKVLIPPGKDYCCQFKVIDTIFQFNAPNRDILNLVIGHVSHLVIDNKGLSHVDLSIAKTANGFLLYKNKNPIDECSHESGIIPIIYAVILMTAYDRSDCLMGLHAAAVLGNNLCILMPAASGKGKSTLTAALIQSGFIYGADDLVLLTDDPGQIIPVPTAIGLKQDSWPVIEAFNPEIRSCREHKRIDNKLIRYLPLQEKKIWNSRPFTSVKADYIVYPAYTPESQSSLEKISSAQSFINLSKAGFDMHQNFNKTLVQQLIDWVKTTPSYSLVFSRLDHAITLLKSIGN